MLIYLNYFIYNLLQLNINKLYCKYIISDRHVNTQIRYPQEENNLNIHEVKSSLGDTFGMTIEQAEILDKFLKEHELTNILELGFAHGVSSCYFAAIIDDMGKGHLTTIDLNIAKFRQPNIDTLTTKLDFGKYMTIDYENKSYTWRLMKLIEENPEPIFDFCYIDCAHDWYNDGFAFLLVDKLLKPGGWIFFDDMW